MTDITDFRQLAKESMLTMGLKDAGFWPVEISDLQTEHPIDKLVANIVMRLEKQLLLEKNTVIKIIYFYYPPQSPENIHKKTHFILHETGRIKCPRRIWGVSIPFFPRTEKYVNTLLTIEDDVNGEATIYISKPYILRVVKNEVRKHNESGNCMSIAIES